MPDEETPQVQAPIESVRTRPSTTDPVWHLLFDRLDSQDDNIKVAVQNTQVIAKEQVLLRAHVNDEQEKFVRLLNLRVEHGRTLNDIWFQVKASRPAQLILAGIVLAMAPVVVANWDATVTSIRGMF